MDPNFNRHPFMRDLFPTSMMTTPYFGSSRRPQSLGQNPMRLQRSSSGSTSSPDDVAHPGFFSYCQRSNVSTDDDTDVEKNVDANRSTKGASKQRRDLINAEIVNLRDKLPLPEAARQRLSQLQVMSLACCFIRKSNYFGKLFGAGSSISDTPFEFSQAMSGFLLICTKEGKLLYISENVTEYLGHSMVDLLTQGDSIYDIIDKRDQDQVQTQLLKTTYSEEERTFFCRMNVSRSFKRQSGFGDHKIMLVKGHFVQPQMRDHYGNQAVFMASCTPLITPDFKESSLHNNTNIFQSIHGLDMKYIETATNGEFHTGYSNDELVGKSWYEMLHPEDLNDAKDKHMQLIKSSHEMGCMLTARVQSKYGQWVWLNIVMHIRQPFMGDNGDPAIVCINNVIGEAEAPLFKLQSQQFSAQIARSPEFLNMQVCASPPHTITQVEGEQLAYRPPFVAGGSQEEGGEGLFRGEFTVTTAMGAHQGSSIGSVSAMVGPPKTAPQSEPFTTTQLSGSPQPKSLSPPADQKQLLREGIMNRIKRKMSESSQACKPAKVPRYHTTNSSGSDGLFNSGYSLQATALVTRCVDIDSLGQSFGGGNGGTSILVGSAPVYEQLAQSKNNIKISLKEEIEVFDQLQQVLSNPSMPLSPESLMSEPVSSPETTHLMIDTTDTAVVPASILTPEASPTDSFEFSSMPFIKEEKNTGFPPELEELSMFSPASMDEQSVGSPESLPPAESPKIRQLPKLDLGDIENYFASMEKTSKMKRQPLIKQEKKVFIKPEQEISLNAEEMEKLVANISDVVFDMVKRSNPVPPSAVMMPNHYSPMESTAVLREEEDMAQVPVIDVDALLETPLVNGNHALLQELHQLNRLDASPSHGDGAVPSAVFDQTL